MVGAQVSRGGAVLSDKDVGCGHSCAAPMVKRETDWS